MNNAKIPNCITGSAANGVSLMLCNLSAAYTPLTNTPMSCIRFATSVGGKDFSLRSSNFCRNEISGIACTSLFMATSCWYTKGHKLILTSTVDVLSVAHQGISVDDWIPANTVWKGT